MYSFTYLPFLLNCPYVSPISLMFCLLPVSRCQTAAGCSSDREMYQGV